MVKFPDLVDVSADKSSTSKTDVNVVIILSNGNDSGEVSFKDVINSEEVLFGTNVDAVTNVSSSVVLSEVIADAIVVVSIMPAVDLVELVSSVLAVGKEVVFPNVGSSDIKSMFV